MLRAQPVRKTAGMGTNGGVRPPKLRKSVTREGALLPTLGSEDFTKQRLFSKSANTFAPYLRPSVSDRPDYLVGEDGDSLTVLAHHARGVAKVPDP